LVASTKFPQALNPGDFIRVVSPAGPVDSKRLTVGIELLKSWGYKVELAQHALEREGFLAGRDQYRIDDLTDALHNESIKGVICSRGGYGVVRLLDFIDWSKFATIEPKVFIGFSDISAFQIALYQMCGWVSFSGPQAAMGLSGDVNLRSLDHLRGMIDGSWRRLYWRSNEDKIKLKPVRENEAEGFLIPSNLSMLVALIGTEYMPDLSGALLCIEDISEPPYRIDRMLWQLRHSRKVDNLVALIIGEFIFEGRSIVDSVVKSALDHFGNTGFPIWRGIPYGHVEDRLTLPVGIGVQIDKQGWIDISEN